MKNLILLIIFSAFISFANAQEESADWTLNLTNHFHSQLLFNRYYTDVNNDVRNDVYGSATNFFIAQPSLRKYIGPHFTEFGIRNAGLSDNLMWQGKNAGFNNNVLNIYSRIHNASISLFYAKNARLINLNRFSFWLGGDLSAHTNFMKTEYRDLTNTEQNHEINNTTMALSLGLIPRIQFELSKRVIIDFSILFQSVNYAYRIENAYYFDQFGPETVYQSTFNIGVYGSPQISVSINL